MTLEQLATSASEAVAVCRRAGLDPAKVPVAAGPLRECNGHLVITAIEETTAPAIRGINDGPLGQATVVSLGFIFLERSPPQIVTPHRCSVTRGQRDALEEFVWQRGRA